MFYIFFVGGRLCPIKLLPTAVKDTKNALFFWLAFSQDFNIRYSCLLTFWLACWRMRSDHFYHVGRAQVLDWLEKHGEVFLRKNVGIGRNLQKARLYQKSHETFEGVVQVKKYQKTTVSLLSNKNTKEDHALFLSLESATFLSSFQLTQR